MKIRQRVKRFDELTLDKQRLTAFISALETNNATILNSSSEDEEVILAKTKLTEILEAKRKSLEEIKKELKEHNYYFSKTQIDLDKYRGTVEYIGEE
jgi:hypothetical protein